MSHDIEVAKQFTAKPIQEIADKLSISPDHILPYGKDIAKVSNDAVKAAAERRKPGKLILVSATTPTAWQASMNSTATT